MSIVQKLKCFFGYHNWKWYYKDEETAQDPKGIMSRKCLCCGYYEHFKWDWAYTPNRGGCKYRQAVLDECGKE